MQLYKFPEEYEKKDELFKIFCDGQEIQAYACDVSAMPFNQVWPGRQRAFTQTEKSAFVTLSNNGETVLSIQPQKSFQTVVVRPLGKIKNLQVNEDCVTVTFPNPGQYTVEFDGMHYTLVVFINPEKDFSNYREGENVKYFAPGVHYIDERMLIEDNQTIFIDAGAVVYGSINAVGKKNIRVVGYGILDNSRMNRQDAIQSTPNIFYEEDKSIGLPINFERCENILVEGITIVNSSEWSMKFAGCRDINVENIKLIGMWRYNADGCDFCNCINATIKNSFLRTFDDTIVVKGLDAYRDMPVENVLAENCVLWCDWGRALEIGAETCAPYMKNILFKNCYIIHGSAVMLDVQQGDSADISNVLFENIQVEYTGEEMLPTIETDEIKEYPHYGKKHTPVPFIIVSLVTMWSHDTHTGDITNVKFKDIKIMTPTGEIPQGSAIVTEETAGKIGNVCFENITVNGQKVTLRELGLKTIGNVDITV